MSLEKFIRDNREEFDNRNPSDQVWHKIKSALPRKRFVTSLQVWRAAAVIFFGLSVYLFATQKKTDVSSLQRELKDIESFYGGQIAEKVAFIDKLETGNYEDDQFSQDVKKLDAMYEVLREEMRTSPSVKVKDALILNMLIRIDLLNQQIQKLEDHRKADDTKKEI